MMILPVGSGKGGVGKSLLAANLSIALAEAGRRVVLADLDLGASNLHTMLGIRGVREGIGTFLTVPRMAFADILLPTEYPGLAFIAGDAEVPGAANLKPGQRRRLVRHLQSLDCDFLVLDLGPGTAAGTLEFFLLAGSGIVVTTPALTAILNAYLFLKNAVFRLMYDGAPRDSLAYEILESLRRESGALQRAYVPRILARIAEEDPESGRAIGALLARFKPLLVLNMLEQPGRRGQGGPAATLRSRVPRRGSRPPRRDVPRRAAEPGPELAAAACPLQTSLSALPGRSQDRGKAPRDEHRGRGRELPHRGGGGGERFPSRPSPRGTRAVRRAAILAVILSAALAPAASPAVSTAGVTFTRGRVELRHDPPGRRGRCDADGDQLLAPAARREDHPVVRLPFRDTRLADGGP